MQSDIATNKKQATDLSPQDGMLLVYKPGGVTSKDVTRWFQTRFGRIKMGHVGTLDPLAEGLLPLLLGRATRLQDFLLAGMKTYEFEIEFGIATDTLDADGRVITRADFYWLDESSLRDVCSALIGEFEQIPPLYSAIKFNGKPLYDYARKGKSDQVPLEELKKSVKIFDLICLDYLGGVGRFRMSCSKGTYVRVVATKIAEELKTVGTIRRLIRLSSGDLTVENSWTIDQLEANLDDINRFIVPMSKIPLSMPRWSAQDDRLVNKLKMGQEIQVDLKTFETGMDQYVVERTVARSLDHVVLFDNNNKPFGIGSAAVLDRGCVAVRMRRGLS